MHVAFAADRSDALMQTVDPPATNFGVEPTARDAWERNYEIIFAEDAMSSFDAEAHAFAIQRIFPRLGRVRSTAEVLSQAFASAR